MRTCSVFILVVHTGLCIQTIFSGYADFAILNAWFFLFHNKLRCFGITDVTLYLFIFLWFPVRIQCVFVCLYIPSIPLKMTVPLTVFGIQPSIYITSACSLSYKFSLLYVSVTTVFVCVVFGSFKWSVHLPLHWNNCWYHQQT